MKSTTAVGRKAEEAVASHLRAHGYKVLEQNWRTRWCEIDIVATKAGTVYFIEVKFRSRSDWGSGIDYITPKKLKQMHFAAEFWLAGHEWDGGATLLVVEVANDLVVKELIEIY